MVQFLLAIKIRLTYEFYVYSLSLYFYKRLTYEFMVIRQQPYHCARASLPLIPSNDKLHKIAR
jgi:hypothetical protein